MFVIGISRYICIRRLRIYLDHASSRWVLLSKDDWFTRPFQSAQPVSCRRLPKEGNLFFYHYPRFSRTSMLGYYKPHQDVKVKQNHKTHCIGLPNAGAEKCCKKYSSLLFWSCSRQSYYKTPFPKIFFSSVNK